MTVRAADAQALLDLYAGAPRMAPYLMDRLLERLRGSLAASFAAYQPSLSLTFVGAQLGFDTLGEVRCIESYAMTLAAAFAWVLSSRRWSQACKFMEERGAAVDPVAGVLITRG
jgi:hypothetical protein